MIGSTRNLRVFAYARPADMRKGFDGLCGLVTRELGADPLSGDVFLFVSADRRRAKALIWDGTGLCIYSKRLEQGRFTSLWTASRDGAVELTMTELSLYLEGSSLVGRVPLSPARFSPQAAAFPASAFG